MKEILMKIANQDFLGKKLSLKSYNNFTKSLKKLLIAILVLLGILGSLLILGKVLDDVDTEISICHDDSGVWDYNEHRCRFDCLTWNDTDGCVKEGNLSEFAE